MSYGKVCLTKVSLSDVRVMMVVDVFCTSKI
jgi:hypothetical protein